MFMKSFVRNSHKQVLAAVSVLSTFSSLITASAFAESFAVVAPAAASASRSVVTQRESFDPRAGTRAKDLPNEETTLNVAERNAGNKETLHKQETVAAKTKVAEKPADLR
jgi:hypothetical protein